MAEWLHAMHDAGGESLFGDKPGWIVHTIALRQERQGNFTQWTNQGITSLVRLNYDHDGQHGTIPPQGDYALFAKMCADYVASSPGITHVIIGNEPNHKQEWPNGVVITPEQYAACFNMCYQQIKERRPDVLVLVAGMACWNDQSGIGWLEYFKRICAAIVNCDGFAIHGYTHGSDPNLIWNLDTVNGWRWHFPVIYQTLATIPERFATLDSYVTETNQGDDAWLDNNNGWVKNAFESVDGYNKTETTQKIRCLALYRWKTDDKYSIVDKQGVQADFRDAVARGYRSPSGTPNPGPTPPPNPNPGPTPPTPEPDDGDYLIEWDSRLDQRGTVLGVVEGTSSNRYEYHVTKGRWYDKDQAQGRVNVFLTLLDEQGNLLKNVPVRWSWNDGQEIKSTEIKSDPWLGGQYSLDFAMYNVAPAYTLQIDDGQPSDILEGMGLGDLNNPDHTIHTCYAFTLQRMAVGSAPIPPDPDELSALFVTAPAGANMRAEPNTGSAILVAVPYREKVLCDGAAGAADGLWRHGFYAEFSGWIRADLLGLERPAPILPPTPGPDPTPMDRLIWPVKGRVTHSFGEGNPVFNQKGHAGIDIAVPIGTPVLAIAEGTVIEVGKEINYGNYVRVLHPSIHSFSFYAHLDQIKCQKGQVVARGDVLGLSGNTGNSSGPHLHLEMRAHDGRGGYANVSYGYLQGRYNPVDAYLVTGSPLSPT